MTTSSDPTERLPDLLDRLYDLHERAGDPYLELWPGSDAIGVLQYTRIHHNVLNPDQRREQIRLRLKVERLLYRLIDMEQLGTLDQARQPGARGGEHLMTLAALAEVLGLATPAAVSNRRDRLRAALHNLPRTPRHGQRLLADQEAETRRNLAKVEQARRHHARVREAAQDLLDVFHDLTLTEEAQDWLHDLSLLMEEDVLRPDQMPSLAAYLSLTLAELDHDSARTPAAADAIVRARAALAYRDR
jgi:hypothetical protein